MRSETESERNLARIINAITYRLYNLHRSADYSDIGDVIGFVLAAEESDNQGFSMDCFEDGVKHGVSVARGTHG